jgi:ethanolamine ammonia-lyase small subunit
VAEPPAPIDFSSRLRAATIARVGLGRIGTALPTRASLDFQLAHARARDAVHAELPPGTFGPSISGLRVVEVNSLAKNRTDYLQRPDLGRRLDPEDLGTLPSGGFDLAVVIADGLSATAVLTHAPAIVAALVARLPEWRIAPIVVAHQARVALGDEIGAALGATLIVMLIGERPGLSAADSVGAYISWKPRPGLRDNARNCISNIRSPHGLGHAEAANQIVAILHGARVARQTGVLLKPIQQASLPAQD